MASARAPGLGQVPFPAEARVDQGGGDQGTGGGGQVWHRRAPGGYTIKNQQEPSFQEIYIWTRFHLNLNVLVRTVLVVRVVLLGLGVDAFFLEMDVWLLRDPRPLFYAPYSPGKCPTPRTTVLPPGKCPTPRVAHW
jgi:hypothetical protein